MSKGVPSSSSSNGHGARPRSERDRRRTANSPRRATQSLCRAMSEVLENRVLLSAAAANKPSASWFESQGFVQTTWKGHTEYVEPNQWIVKLAAGTSPMKTKKALKAIKSVAFH